MTPKPKATAAEAPLLSVVIPAFNEEARIGPTLERSIAYLRTRPFRSEVLVVLDGCSDGTERIARGFVGGEIPVSVLALPENRGKGFAVRCGMLTARGERILFSDADLSTPIEESQHLLAALDAGHQVAIGSRAMPLSDIRHRQPWWRERMGKVFNLWVRGLRLSRFRDTQCGFKCFTRQAAAEIFTRARLDGFGFDVEVLWIAARLGLRVAEVPVVWIDDRLSRVHPLRDSTRMLLDLLRIRYLDRRGAYARGLNPPRAEPAAKRPVDR